MSQLKRRYTNLSQFFGSYFHQDWVEEFDCPNEALENAINSEPREFIEKVFNEFKELNLSETGRENMLIELDCYYAPESDGISVSDWLIKVEKEIVESCK